MNSVNKYGILFFILFGSQHLFSQTGTLKTDTTITSQATENGRLSGQVRYFFMATDNEQPLTDYYAHALSVSSKYETRQWKGFSLVAGGAALFNLSSSDLEKIDPLPKRPNRYEAGLFDLRNPNKTVGFRAEELYLQYALKKGVIRMGSQLINTPFINPQDGRMRPTFVSGLYTILTFSSTQIEGGWIGAVLPRSINGWYNAGSSIGLNPQGINTDGTPSNYGGHLSSKGIFLAGITYSISPDIKLKLWEQYADNLFHTALVQIDAESGLRANAKLLASLQYTHQVKVNEGGSSEMSGGYFTSDHPAQVLSAMTGMKVGRFEGSFNYTRIFKQARYLMPREWGREPFFTFMPRERNEGFGNVHAFVIKTAYNFSKVGLKTSLQAGRFRLPDVKNVALNKYGMPSYVQVNVEVRYLPPFAAKFDLQALYVYKAGNGNTYRSHAYVFNKVNMSLYNLMINYTW